MDNQFSDGGQERNIQSGSYGNRRQIKGSVNRGLHAGKTGQRKMAGLRVGILSLTYAEGSFHHANMARK